MTLLNAIENHLRRTGIRRRGSDATRSAIPGWFGTCSKGARCGPRMEARLRAYLATKGAQS